jgi:REP element-mobilizing transposase RayT
MTDFKGWTSRGYLPHFDAPNTIQAVTFRLADSLPVEAFERIIADRPPNERAEAVETLLDSGRGQCLLRHEANARLVEDALLHFDGERCRLLAWVIMPNHVHVVVEPILPLADLLHGWKSFTAKAMNTRMGRKGRVWQPDYFDRFIRDSRHLERVVQYVEFNPVTAGLCRTPAAWRWGSAYWRDG